jgi:hypothetical protein
MATKKSLPWDCRSNILNLPVKNGARTYKYILLMLLKQKHCSVVESKNDRRKVAEEKIKTELSVSGEDKYLSLGAERITAITCIAAAAVNLKQGALYNTVRPMSWMSILTGMCLTITPPPHQLTQPFAIITAIIDVIGWEISQS